MKEHTNYKARLSATTSWLQCPLLFLIIVLFYYSVQRPESEDHLILYM